ncbi:unnamed protein product [Closterium sp. NIES-53]
MQHGRIVHVAPPLATHSHVLAGGAAIITLGGDAAWEDRARGTAVHAAPPLATHFHAPPPLLPLTCWQAMQRSSLVVAMQHGRIVHVAPPAALMPELMLGDAGVDEGACMGDADKSMHDGSRIDAHTRGLLVKLLGEQQGERDGEEGGKEGESSSLKGSGRGDGKEIAENVEAGEAAGEPGGLSTMEGRGVSGAAACTTGAASEESRQEDGAPRPDNPDMKCRGCSSGGKGEKAGAALEEEERREAGSVRLSVYRRYCAAVGWPLLALVLASLALMQGSRNAADVTLSLWTDAPPLGAMRIASPFQSLPSLPAHFPLPPLLRPLSPPLPAPDSEAATNAFYLRLFTFIALLNSLLTLLRAFSFARAGMTAAHRVHHELLAAVVRTPLAFFDTNPSGRILNRFSSDLYTVDDSLPFIANILLANSFSLAGIAALLLYTQWTFLLLLLPLTYIYSIIQHLYRQSSRELRRLDSAARSPVYAAFSQLLHGAPTIRAFHAQEHMMRGAMALMSASQHASFSEMAASQWLSVRLQLMAAVVVTFVSVTGIMTTHSLPNVSHPNHLFPNQSPLNHSPPSSTAHQAFPLAPAAPHLPSPLPHLLFPDFNNTSSSFPLLSDPASGHTLPLPINTSLLLPPLQSLSLPALPSISHHFSSLQADGASALWLSPAALLAACPNAWSGTWSGVLSGAASSARARVLLKGLSSVPVIRSIINALQSLLSLALSAPHLLFESATTTTAAVSPGLLGLALAYALPIVSLLNGTLTSLADTEKDMVAVERVLEYLDLQHEQDAPPLSPLPGAKGQNGEGAWKDAHAEGEGIVVAGGGERGEWPKEGRVEFRHVSMAYRVGLPLVLSDVSFLIPGGSQVGIAGRTGAGKSSLLAALFRLRPLSLPSATTTTAITSTTSSSSTAHMHESSRASGIFIDGVDTAHVSLSCLRTALAIIPQTPLIFHAPIRDNLDPEGKHADVALWDAVRKCHLGAAVGRLGGLDAMVGGAAGGLSLGERQLLCLARVMLRKSKVLCLDECTANIDAATSALMHATIAREFHGVTTITVAHRVSSLLSLPRVLIFEAGALVEDGDPKSLLLNPDSKFSLLSRAALAAPHAAPGGPLATPAALLAAPCGPPTASCCCLPSALRCPASPRSACYTAMASLRVLAFDHEGRPNQFDTWLDDLQLYLLSDSRDSVSLFDHTSGAAPAPPATADTRYSSPATAAIGRLLLPYLFPELSAFAIVEDLVSHLRASDARYRAAAPAEFLDRNQPPMFITLYFIVTRLPDSLLSVRDHFLSLDLTVLTVDLLEQHLLTAETSVVAVDVPRSTPRMPFFEGCSPSPLVPSYVSAAAAVEVLGAEDVGAASASAKRRSSKGRGGRGGGGGNGSGGGGSSGGSGGSGGGGSGGSGGGSGGFGGGGGGSAGSGGSGSGGSGGGRTGAQRGELLMSGVAIFDLDYDAILSSMYALSTSAEHDCYRCVPPDPGIEAAALGASEYSLPGTAPAEALHTFTLDSGASRCFFRDSTTLTPLPAPVPVRLANPSAVPSGSLSGLHLPSFSTNLVSTAALQDSMVTTTTPGGQRVSIRTCTRTGRHLAMFTCRPGSSLYTLATEPPEVAASAQDLPDLRLHSDRGGEFSSDLLRDFCHGEGILQSFTLPASPQQNGIAERRIGLVMEVACTSMIHAVAPHFLWPFAVRYAAHQLNLWPRVSLLETSPTLRWTGEAGNASVFRFYHPTSHRVFPSQDITFDKSVPFYHLFPYCSAPPSPPPLFLAPGPPPVDPLPPQGPAPSGVSQVDPPPSTVPVEVAGDSGAARDAAPGGVKPGGAEPGGAEPGGVEPGGAESEGAGSRGAEPGGAEPGGSEPWGVEPRGPTGASPRLSPRPEPLSPQQLREWLVWRARLRSGAAEAGATGDTGAGGASISARAGGTGGTAAAGPGGARSGGTGAAGTGGVGGAGAGDPTEPGAAEFGGAVAGGPGAGGAGAGGPGAGGAEDGGAGSGGTGTGGAVAGGARAVDPGAGGAGAGGAGGTGAGATVQPRPYFVPLLQQVFGVPSSTALTPPLLCPPPDQPQPPLQLASPLPAPPYAEQSGGLTERREPASRPVSPVRTTRRVPRSRPPLVPGTHAMALRPSSAPLRIPLPPPPESSLLAVPDPRSDLVHAASPSVSRLLATVVTDPSFESAAASALVAELLDFAAACRLDYASALVAESAIRCSRLQSATGG